MLGKWVGEVENRGRFLPQFRIKAKKILKKLSPSYPTVEQKNVLKQIKEYFVELSKHSRIFTQSAPVLVKRQHDNRPYIVVDIFGNGVTALLDSGSNNSILGADGLRLLDMFNLKVRRSNHKFVTTADGVHQSVKDTVNLPLRIGEVCGVISALIVPSLKHTFILGSDFCTKFQVMIDFRNDKWEVWQC